ncbi:MAG: cytidine deaminase [Blastopirellula sp.]|nr:MAG: cytidine deaminase [Blastopirellula sp.]
MSDQPNHEIDCELVIGLVAAVGTKLSQVTEHLTEQLELAGYETQIISISSDLISMLKDVPESRGNNFKRINQLMTAGNELRASACEVDDELGRQGDAVLAYGAATRIFLDREKQGGTSLPNGKKAFIISSLKRPEEVDALRAIYPQGFVLIGVHAEEDRRRENLISSKGMSTEEANTLIQRDGDESNVKHGQRVKKTFHLADFFVSLAGGSDQIQGDISRMVRLWFGCPFYTPTFDEFAMYFAYSAALRSADLSRQVGAVITRNNQILSTGANECPSAEGGLYWPERGMRTSEISDFPDGRDYTRGFDSNKKEQLAIIKKIVDRGVGEEFQLDRGKLQELLEKSSIGDLTEYGRVVHAEMEALLSCGRIGVSTLKTNLYCTTFPCHNCAKHIIAAGVERVIYIEPYPKSKALEFHDESIDFSSEPSDNKDIPQKVRFEPFVGIGPRKFFDLFSMKLGSSYDLIRKDEETGKKIEWDIRNARLRLQMKPSSYLDSEYSANVLFQQFQDDLAEQDGDA